MSKFLRATIIAIIFAVFAVTASSVFADECGTSSWTGKEITFVRDGNLGNGKTITLSPKSLASVRGTDGTSWGTWSACDGVLKFILPSGDRYEYKFNFPGKRYESRVVNHRGKDEVPGDWMPGRILSVTG